MFPVCETAVYTDKHGSEGIPNLSNGYKAIVRKDNGKLISIARESYKLIPNREVIAPLLEQLHRLDTSWFVDSSHSFVTNERMRLQVTFPELVFNDGKSDIALSLFLHNSYDSSEGVRMFFGAIRAICKNGMVFGEVLSKFYGRHTSGFNIGNLRQQLETTCEQVPVIRHRIMSLQDAKVTKDIRQNVDRRLGKRVTKYIEQQEKETQRATNQWILYNIITYYISHLVKKKMMASYQMQLSKVFGL